MDDKRIEQLIRESGVLEMPDGMRERVLRRSFNELPKKRAIIQYWKPILACAAILFVIFANVSDTMVQERLASDIGKTPARTIYTADSLLSWQREIRSNSGLSLIDASFGPGKGVDQL